MAEQSAKQNAYPKFKLWKQTIKILSNG